MTNAKLSLSTNPVSLHGHFFFFLTDLRQLPGWLTGCVRRIRDDGEDVLQDVAEVGLVEALGGCLLLGDVLEKRVKDLQACGTEMQTERWRASC